MAHIVIMAFTRWQDDRWVLNLPIWDLPQEVMDAVQASFFLVHGLDDPPGGLVYVGSL
jgi:hypothetical protein